MVKYKRVLMALDLFGDDDGAVVERGREVACENGAALYLIHVIERLSVARAIDDLGVSAQLHTIESDIRRAAEQKIDLLCERLEIPLERRMVCQGNPADEIHSFATEQDIDLIVLGTHGQSGLQLLLGSTANSVLHGVSCDVLAVRIKRNRQRR